MGGTEFMYVLLQSNNELNLYDCKSDQWDKSKTVKRAIECTLHQTVIYASQWNFSTKLPKIGIFRDKQCKGQLALEEAMREMTCKLLLFVVQPPNSPVSENIWSGESLWRWTVCPVTHSQKQASSFSMIPVICRYNMTALLMSKGWLSQSLHQLNLDERPWTELKEGGGGAENLIF